MMIHPVRVTPVNRVRVIARVINVSSCLFIPFTVFLHLHCLVLPFSCLYIYCSSRFRFLIQYITCYCHPLSSKVVICILLICITVIIREHNTVLQSVFCNCIRARAYYSLPHSLRLTVCP